MDCPRARPRPEASTGRPTRVRRSPSTRGSARDLGHGDLSTDRVRSPFDHGIQPRRPADRKTDEAMNAGRDREPAHHGLLVRAAAKDDAADCRAPAAPCRFDDLLAILATIESLDFPDIRLDPGVLQRVNRLDHQRRTQLAIVRRAVAAETLELRGFRRYQQLEHEQPLVLAR